MTAPVAAGATPGVARAALTQVLAQAGVPSPAADARWLLEHVLGKQVALATAPLTADEARELCALASRRVEREPLQHILGQMAFRHLTLLCAPGTFVARPETELVAQAAIDAARAAGKAPVVVDLCTGSGAIALAVATEVPGSRVWALEFGQAPLELAGRNIAALAPQVRLIEGDVRQPIAGGELAELAGSVDVVVSNPPYVPPAAVPTDPEVSRFDPALALYGQGADGLGHVAAVLERARELLRPGGRVFIEHAEVQGPAVVTMAAKRGFLAATTMQDLSGRPRYLAATWPGEESQNGDS
ncbi:MAG: peptide chain release factor N(5)-glutamine methyltransferase [Buchananella hordeovulneris]|nr:peptide chain release factor N(5)-glutamine methyltransferase [Buchananella hordeovulneris]